MRAKEKMNFLFFTSLENKNLQMNVEENKIGLRKKPEYRKQEKKFKNAYVNLPEK